jgi:putative ubiquitin-RnfH superfamily antitoxin RatB of RatAB toxin-antitoxin module
MGRKTLSLVESMKLMNLIQERFVESGMSDTQFAAAASAELGFEVVENHVYVRRTELGIPANRAKAETEILSLSQRLESVERQLAADQKEFRGLSAVFLDLKARFETLEKACRLKGAFERTTP